MQERAAAGEVAAPLEVGLPGPGAGHCLVPAHDPDQALELPTKFRESFHNIWRALPGGIANVVRLDVLNATLLWERETMNYGTTQKINGQITLYFISEHFAVHDRMIDTGSYLV